MISKYIKNIFKKLPQDCVYVQMLQGPIMSPGVFPVSLNPLLHINPGKGAFL